ncbi:MAG: hypothetical protein MK073_04405 [Phycisphaerales bacterium]|nr:hypothetical protein [Phycisphaerales bacterium]
MTALHFIAPSSPSTSSELIGLLRLVCQHIGGGHEIVVLGSEEETKQFRSYGLNVIGNISGVENQSRTLASRIGALLDSNAKHQHVLYGWGYRTAAALSCVDTTKTKICYVDDIEHDIELVSNKMTIMTPSVATASLLRARTIASIDICEPLIGLRPFSLILDRTLSRNQLGVSHELLVSCIGKYASPQGIIEMLMRLECAGKTVKLVLPEQYQFQSELMGQLSQMAMHNEVVLFPPHFRQVDVLHAADAVWVPETPEYVESHGVLDVLRVAWEGIPLAVTTNHAVHSIPTIGKRVAWASDEIDVTAWINAFDQQRDEVIQSALELAHRIRAVTSPTRFVDGFLMRLPSSARF